MFLIIKNILIFLGLKEPSLKMYFFIINSYDSLKLSWRNFINPIKAKKQLTKGYLNIYLDSDWLGFGARLIKLIELLHLASLHKIELNIEFGYNDGKKKKYFNELFEPTTKRLFKKKKYIRIEDTTEVVKGINLNKQLNLIRANKLLNNSFRVKSLIQKEVDDFVDLHFKNEFVLGVHFRGTDKIGEAPRINEEKLFSEIDKCLVSGTFSKIFISTDEAPVLEKVKMRFPEIPVIWRKDVFRSNNGDQFHRKVENSKDIINCDALMNILILSRTNFLLKTASIMSDCSFIFNPYLSYKIISLPHSDNLTWWPCTELQENMDK
jgi:hypothetical protein